MDDAAESAARLGIRLETLEIDRRSRPRKRRWRRSLPAATADVTEENLQARVRGLLLMGLSNKFGELLVTTGNKSEMSVGYATLYGDMCGGYSVLKDIYKTEVYALARWRNTQRSRRGRAAAADASSRSRRSPRRRPRSSDPIRPIRTRSRRTTILDAILHGLIEEEQSVDQIVAAGFAREHGHACAASAVLSRYKRRQAPPGVKITRKSFGRDRRYPMTNAFRE